MPEIGTSGLMSGDGKQGDAGWPKPLRPPSTLPHRMTRDAGGAQCAHTVDPCNMVASGYNWCALVEADISRWKRVIGDGLRSQTDGRQATEVAIAVQVLNHMLDLGRPDYVRVA